MARVVVNSTAYYSVGDVSAIDITGTALTVMAFVFPTSLSAAKRAWVTKASGDAGAFSGQYGVETDGSALHVLAGDLFISTLALTANQWNHIGLVKNGTGAGALAAYLNGSSQTTTSNGSIANGAESLRFGLNNQGAHGADGRIAQVCIWNVALSAAEVFALSRGASPYTIRPTSLKGFWPLFGVASPEPDLSGNGNPATATGTPAAADHAPVSPIVLP